MVTKMESGSLPNVWTMSKGNNYLRYNNYEKRIKNKKKRNHCEYKYKEMANNVLYTDKFKDILKAD